MSKSPVNGMVNFKIHQLIKKHKGQDIKVICEKDGYLDHNGFNLYISSSNGKDWFDSAAYEKTALKKKDWAMNCIGRNI